MDEGLIKKIRRNMSLEEMDTLWNEAKKMEMNN